VRLHLALITGASLLFGALPGAFAQSGSLSVPGTVEAGAGFSIQTTGSGSAALYIVGPSQVFEQEVQLGGAVMLPAGSITHAGHYLVAVVTPSSTQTASLDVLPATEPASISFLAEPSRLPVDLRDAITGAAYVFDSYANLITKPLPMSFKLSAPSGAPQVQTVTTRNGAAWVRMNSTPQRGEDTFIAQAGSISVSRSVHQVAGDPCQLTMSAHPSGPQLELETNPVRDCSGNPVPDGTIVTFTESYDGGLSSADVPLKRGIAKAYLPAHPGGVLSVASGVVLGNQIHWEK